MKGKLTGTIKMQNGKFVNKVKFPDSKGWKEIEIPARRLSITREIWLRILKFLGL